MLSELLRLRFWVALGLLAVACSLNPQPEPPAARDATGNDTGGGAGAPASGGSATSAGGGAPAGFGGSTNLGTGGTTAAGATGAQGATGGGSMIVDGADAGLECPECPPPTETDGGSADGGVVDGGGSDAP